MNATEKNDREKANRESLSLDQIETAFDMLGLKTEEERSAFFVIWNSEGEQPPSGRFQLRLGHSSNIV